MLHRETIRKPAEAESKWVRHLGGKSEYAHVQILIEPMARGAGIHLVPIDEQFFPAEYFSGVERGLISALASGVLARCEVTDLQATVTNGSYHEVDSCNHSFAQATEDAVRRALEAAEPYLLEAVLNVFITVPEEFAGAVISAINTRGGMMRNMEHLLPKNAGRISIAAAIPERTIGGLEGELAYLSDSHAVVSSAPGGYEELPTSIARQLRYCPGCERKVLPQEAEATCPDCGLPLEPDGDDSAV